MKFKDILYEKRDGIAIATFNRPDSLNAFRNGTLREFEQILKDVSQDKNLQVLVLTGKGRAFKAGRDLKELSFLYESASSTTTGTLMTSLRLPKELAKKSPNGASTPGRSEPS